MSERKVLSKYYPPNFDPADIQRRKGKKPTGPQVQVVRLMSPFSMKCTSCGEYIGKGRKFNARKETPLDDKYLRVQLFRFYIRCTRCSSEIVFRTDPKNQDYVCERGAKRSVEPWRLAVEETDQERLDRLEAEELEADHDPIQDLEAKTLDAQREMAVADALDTLRLKNAARERLSSAKGGAPPTAPPTTAEELDRADAEEARRAFQLARASSEEEAHLPADDAAPTAVAAAAAATHRTGSPQRVETGTEPAAPAPSFQRTVKKKKNLAAVLGIKKKSVAV